jgi:uncharacterized membrane protein YesL
MNFLYLAKATVVCGGSAFLIYSFPIISQIFILALLALGWFSCAHRTLRHLKER